MRPGLEDYVGNYVRAIHEFKSGLSGEVDLAKDDVVKVTKVIDNNWLHGIYKDKEGNFPRDFVEKITLPRIEADQKVFAATDNFPAQQDGDLDFRKGDIIVGLFPIDECWWQGQLAGMAGIFPVTHVMELELPQLLKQRSMSVHATEPLFAQALVDSVAQLDEELGFKTGDIITVTEVVDTDWYIGECHGKSGMFLASCVRLLNEEECQDCPAKPVNHSFIISNRNSADVSSVNSSSSSQSPRQSEDLYSHKETYSSHHTSTESGQSRQDSERMISFTAENTKAHTDSDDGVTPYARTLYPFQGELSDELSFDAHDIVTLIQHVDEQWIEGELNGKIGVFPANYVEIVVDCPYAYFSDSQKDPQAGPEAESKNGNENLIDRGTVDKVNTEVSETKTYPNDSCGSEDKPHNAQIDEIYALVLYPFRAETNQDIDLIEGETLSVIKRIDENWLYVRNEAGQQGMCPSNFVEVIGEIPATSDKIHDANDNEVRKGIAMDDNKTELKPHKPVQSESDPSKRGSGSNSSNQLNESDSVTLGKPSVKPKPSLAPKPALKPKPALSAKPKLKSDTGLKSVHFNGGSSIPKSSSSQALSESVLDTNDTSSQMTKASSMFEISKSASLSQTSLAESTCSESGSNSSLTMTTPSSPLSSAVVAKGAPGVNVADTNVTPNKKSFDNWDMTKPLDNLLQSEFDKAREEAQKKEAQKKLLSKSSHLSHQSSVDTPPSTSGSSSSFSRPAVTPNYSRSLFEQDTAVGNSVFFLNENHDDFVTKASSPPRKPPQPPLARTTNKEATDFNRRPSLKKPAPKRPVGPRIAPLPSKTPLIPIRTIPPKQPASNQLPSQAAVPARPSGQVPRKHARPAPPRPRAVQPDVDSLMRFSPPPNTSLGAEVPAEPDSELVQELRSRISDLQAEIQTFKKSKDELLLMQQNAPEDKVTEIHDNIQFYDDNISGLTEELKSLKAQLAELCPREKSKQELEKAAEQQRLEEQKAKEALKKQLEEKRMERKEKRQKVIEELIQTEKAFITSLHLIMETFISSSAQKHPDVDVELLFGNIEEVADVSQQLYTKLEEATNGKDFSQQVIGTCFVTLAEDMKNVYAPYCRNHDDVITLIEKYSQNEGIKMYLEAQLDILRKQHVVFDLEALLIKPVQRVLKYPLLLNELIKSTDDDHPDKKELLAGVTAMTDVATAINEYKRRKDLVYKYKRDSNASVGDKLSKLNLHSLKKKSSRMKERFSANLGFIDQTRDPVFEKHETKFRYLEKTVKLFVRDVQNYLDELQEGVSSLESLSADIEDYYGEKETKDVRQLQAFQNKIHITLLPNFRVEAEELVLMPLNQLGQMFEGPNNVIQKRYDKLLDYDNMKRKAQSDKTLEKALQAAKQTYEALNDQLLDELPRLYSLSFQLLRDCVGSFVQAQREFTGKILEDMYSWLDVQILSDQGTLETFNIQHTTIVDQLASLSFMPRAFSPRVADQKADKKTKRMSLDSSNMRSMEAMPQPESQRVYVIQQYPSNKLFKVTETYIATDAMDISLCAGDIVGVIVEKDPMGNKEKWFVDNGVTKGLILKKYLVAYESSASSTPTFGQPARSSHLLQPTLSDPYISPSFSPNLTGNRQSISTSAIINEVEEDDMDFALEEDMTPEVTGFSDPVGQGHDNQMYGQNEDEIEKLPAFYYAEFPFEARAGNEVSLFEHQVVTVHTKHDQNGNPEWWFVDADGSHGYAPAAYLRKMDVHSGPT